MNKTENFKTFFIVEDNRIFAKTVVKGLEKEFPDFMVKSFSTGEEMLSYMETNPDESPVIFILDYYLNSEVPDAMDGGEILAKLRKKYTGRVNDMRVIMLTSSTEIKQAVELLQKGAFQYIVKDEVFFDTLKPTIMQILDYQAMKQQQKISKDKAEFYKKQLFYAKAAGAVMILAVIGLIIWLLLK